jgi:S-adenosylmethionine-diacylglycerol 3-amino-3-carboxypropyl transferase
MLAERISRAGFRLIHQHNLVYNTCWEDPRLDREALQLGPDDRVLMITSAGCNALDYVLAGAGHVDAVDLNPRQNALLELKLAGIRELKFEEFFDLFGRGRTAHWDWLYPTRLRPALSASAARYWDARGKFFAGGGRRNSFYFRGTSGWFAWMVNAYLARYARVRETIDRLLNSSDVEEQRDIYERRQLEDSVFRPMIRWLLRRDAVMALLGVPRSQRQQLDREHDGGVAGFIMQRIRRVFTELPLADNYFWRVYLTGSYSPRCCPEYLKPENFSRLKAGLVDRVQVHTNSVSGLAEQLETPASRFVLLDHMDWLYAHHRKELTREWEAVLNRAAPGCRVIWRSAGCRSDWLDNLRVFTNSGSCSVGERLEYDRPLAERLHARDRVNTYGSFWIADVKS